MEMRFKTIAIIALLRMVVKWQLGKMAGDRRRLNRETFLDNPVRIRYTLENNALMRTSTRTGASSESGIVMNGYGVD